MGIKRSSNQRIKAFFSVVHKVALFSFCAGDVEGLWAKSDMDGVFSFKFGLKLETCNIVKKYGLSG